MSWAIFWILLLFCNAAVYADDIPMLGIAEDGSPIEIFVPESTYQERLTQAVVSLQEATLPILEQKSQTSTDWMLRSVVVGLGVRIDIGLGNLIRFGIIPRFRLAFSNHKEPAIP